MSDGKDDDQPPQGERQRQRSRSRERENPHVPVPQEPLIQPMGTPEPDDDKSDVDFTIINPSSLSAGPPPSAEQKISPEETKDLDRVSEYLQIHPRMLASSLNLLFLFPKFSRSRLWQLRAQVKIQQLWIHKNRVSDHSRSPQDQEDSRRQGPQTQKGKKTVAEKQPITPPKAKKHKSKDLDEDDEEPQNEPGTSSTSQPTVPVQPPHQGPGASSQRPAASAISGDEDSEYSDECSA